MSGSTRRMWRLDDGEAEAVLRRAPAAATGNTQPLYSMRAEQADRILKMQVGDVQVPAPPPLPNTDEAIPAPWMYASPSAAPTTFDEADFAATERPLRRLARRCLALFGIRRN